MYATSSEATDRPASPSMPKPAPLRRNISRRLIWDGLENSDEFCMSSTPSGDAIESAGKKDGSPPISRLNPVIRVTRPSLGRMSSVWVGRQAAVTSAANTFAKRCVHQTIKPRLDDAFGTMCSFESLFVGSFSGASVWCSTTDAQRMGDGQHAQSPRGTEFVLMDPRWLDTSQPRDCVGFDHGEQTRAKDPNSAFDRP